MSNQSVFRVIRELSEIQKHGDLSIAVACKDVDVRTVKALIIGPTETPYEFGFFDFSVVFPDEYPEKAPTVNAKTTNGGRCRFNPNIYSNGKVCLSILGTWRGEPGENWSSAQGLESILISIQSLMSPNPYENEPGFENCDGPDDQKQQEQYIDKIRHETLRISIIERLEEYLNIHSDGVFDGFPELVEVDQARGEYDVDPIPPPFEPFKDLCKRRFLWYYDSYLRSIDEAEKKVKPNQSFAIMPFEGGGNTMGGHFCYPELRRRLNLIHDVLFLEIDYWARESALATRKDYTIASQMTRQFEQIVESYKNNDSVTLDLEMVNKNPMVWLLTYFGRPMSNLDGGMFKVKIFISPRFPEEQPRVVVETKMYHHRVSKDGILCYFPKRQDELKHHVEGIIEAIEDIDPPYDPRTIVNPEASKLYWGSPEDKKQYNRLLRRAVQRSMEE